MMTRFNLTVQRLAPLALKRAILLYEGGDRTLATIHEVEAREGKQPTILAGKALTARMSRWILQAVSRNGIGVSFLPECALMACGDRLMWYEPPQVRHLGFKQSTQFPARSPGTLSGTAPTPGVIFLVEGNSWRVMAYRGEGRPTPGTPLYRAPTLNTYQDGAICTGNVRTPSSTAAESIQAWSDAFWHSNFTHANYEGVVDYEGDAPKLWKDALLSRFGTTFPDHVLKPYNQTLGEYLAELARR